MQATIDTMAAYLARGLTEQEGAELDVRFHDICIDLPRIKGSMIVGRIYAHRSMSFSYRVLPPTPTFANMRLKGIRLSSM